MTDIKSSSATLTPTLADAAASAARRAYFIYTAR